MTFRMDITLSRRRAQELLGDQADEALQEIRQLIFEHYPLMQNMTVVEAEENSIAGLTETHMHDEYSDVADVINVAYWKVAERLGSAEALKAFLVLPNM